MKHALLSLACVAVMFSGCKSHQEPKTEARAPGAVEDVEILEILPEKDAKDGSTEKKSTTMVNPNGNTNGNRADSQNLDADQAVVQQIRRALADDSFLARYVAVRITSKNGEVLLRGVVETVQDKDAIEKKVRGLHTVKKVDNRLEVVPEPAYHPQSR